MLVCVQQECGIGIFRIDSGLYNGQKESRAVEACGVLHNPVKADIRPPDNHLTWNVDGRPEDVRRDLHQDIANE
jgi:hypothetical protein